MNADQIESVRRASVRTLEQVGIIMEHPRARGLLAEAGAEVRFNSHLVRIPEAVVEKALSTAPSEFAVAGGNESKDFVLGWDTPPRARPVMSLDWVLDHGAKQRRAATTRDLESWVRMADALPNLSLVTGLYAWDAPPEIRDLRAAQAMLTYSDKPMLIAPFAGAGVRVISEMLGLTPRRSGAGAIIFSSCNSPLIYSESQMDVLLAAVDVGLPVMVNSSAVTGATAPVTLAGSLVVMNAEILAGLTVAQLAKPGTPVIYAGHPIVLDLRTSIASSGHTENGLLAAAMVELGRSYRLPTTSNGVTTDSHVCDEQAAIEKWVTGYQALASGAALNGGAGTLGSLSTVSLEQLLIDDDIYGRMFRFSEGISFDDETLACGVIASVGPNRHYLEEDHTLRFMRREFKPSRLANRQNPEVWLAQGARDLVEAAAEKAAEVLRKPLEPRCGAHVAQELQRIVDAVSEPRP